ncbi:K(+)/H(+) antiporter [Linnemannia schmuckeri]|uniref:K(+)/H(+) antiporter n=1 Tax=Linnemannia schmuckeri TaxID=64567 RepID=A0A9P5RR17_9FUNG|nr:K(+)/H(+) antiporter [Linnemannia schmuckeri]
MTGSVITGLNPTHVNPSNPFPLFVIQAVIIIGLCYFLHLGLRRLKQPRVISEVIAGIILGPSVMGRIPGFASTIFHPDGLPYLNLVSNIGLVMFLFLVGLELDPALVLKRARFALGISFAGMALPLGVGAAVSYVLYEELGPDTTVGFGQFLLFCGVAIASKITPLYVVLLSIAWILVLCFIVRPIFNFMIRVTKSQDEPSQTMMAFTLGVVLVSAFVTDIIGVHAIFGSFIVGLIIPNETGFADGVTKRIEDLVSVIFLPIYFALSGLKTQVGLLDNGRIWGLVVLTTFVACFGKITGCTIAAKVQGMEWRESFAIGILMNCKGLIELIVLNIGYDAGVINDKVFVIMVAMCLITTCMTTPGVSWAYPPHYQRASAMRALAKERKLTGAVVREDPLDVIDNKGFMLCLDKIHNLPAMMTFLEMLNHSTPATGDNAPAGSHSSLSVPGSNLPMFKSTADENTSSPKIMALRLLHLTERSSSVLMAATERAEVLRRDALMTVFQAFAKLNKILVHPRMTLSTDPDDFANSICDEAAESGSGVIIVPWNSTSLPDPPMNNAEGENPVLSRPLVTSNTQLVSRLLNTTANSGLVTAIFVDREYGGAGHFSNIVVQIYGSLDDEEVLKMASALSHNRLCNIVIIRVDANKELLDEKEVRVNIDNESVVSSTEEHVELPQDNQLLVHTYFAHRAFAHNDKRANNKRTSDSGAVEAGLGIYVHVVPTLQDSIGLAKTILGSRDLLILGRGLTTKQGRAASTFSPDTHQQAPMGVYGTSTSAQYNGSNSRLPGLQLQNLPTGVNASAVGTPQHPIDNPLDTHEIVQAGPSSSGLRPRSLRAQPSSRDLHNSFMTVTSIIGVVAQKYLSSGVACCLLVVQSGSRPAGVTAGPGNDMSRVGSAVTPESNRSP